MVGSVSAGERDHDGRHPRHAARRVQRARQARSDDGADSNDACRNAARFAYASTPLHARSLGLQALYNALEFARSNFESEIERNMIMQTICQVCTVSELCTCNTERVAAQSDMLSLSQPKTPWPVRNGVRCRCHTRADQGALLCCRNVLQWVVPCATICCVVRIVLCDTGAERADQGARLSVPRLRRRKALRQAPAARPPPIPSLPSHLRF